MKQELSLARVGESPAFMPGEDVKEFIKGYRAAIAAAQRDTEPRIERVVAEKESSSDTGEGKLL